MELKILILLSLFCGSTFGQSIQCSYVNITFNGVMQYGCNLNIQNPAGFDNFTTIAGTHAAGRNDSDVTVLITALVSRTVNFPQILCRQFPNLIAIDFSWMDVAVINENTLSGCRSLEWLRFWLNEIEEIHERAFVNNVNLGYLDLDNNNFLSLPDNVFSSLTSLQALDLSNNNLGTFPVTLFSNLTRLEGLLLSNTRLTGLNPQWFANLVNLDVLTIYNNNITTLTTPVLNNLRSLTFFEITRNPLGNLPGNTFDPLVNLTQLNMARIGTNEINRRWFQNLRNLEVLYIYSNSFTSIPANVFDDLISLWAIDIGDNRLTDSSIPPNLFARLTNLRWLINDFNLIQNLNPAWFVTLRNLVYLDFNFNQVDNLPEGIFTPFDALVDIEFWESNVKTLDREAFGNIGSLSYVDFDDNVINAIDEQFLLQGEPLNYLYLANNLCIRSRFYLFGQNRDSFMPRLAICTRNYLFSVDTVTERSDQYNFYQGPYPGIQLRVNAPENINIALTPFNFPWTPMVEIFIGVGNNTLSRIVRNRETEVVVVPTPNILEEGRWSGFRVTWSNQVILVSREGQQYPFMAYTLEDFFPVNFYGLRSPHGRASWSIQPVEAEVSPFEV